MRDKELLQALTLKGANEPADFVAVVVGFIAECLKHGERRLFAKHFASALLHQELSEAHAEAVCDHHELLRLSAVELLQSLSTREPAFFLDKLFEYIDRRMTWPDIHALASFIIGGDRMLKHIETVFTKMEGNGGA